MFRSVAVMLRSLRQGVLKIRALLALPDSAIFGFRLHRRVRKHEGMRCQQFGIEFSGKHRCVISCILRTLRKIGRENDRFEPQQGGIVGNIHAAKLSGVLTPCNGTGL